MRPPSLGLIAMVGGEPIRNQFGDPVGSKLPDRHAVDPLGILVIGIFLVLIVQAWSR